MPSSLYLLALGVFAMGTSEFMLAGLLPAIAGDLGVPVGTAGLLTSAYAIGMVAGAPLTAALARRWPRRAGLATFLTVFLAAHAAGAITGDFGTLFATRVIAALANAGYLAVALTTASALVPGDRKGRALAVLLSGTTIATVVGVPGGVLLGTLLDWRATFGAVALLCVPPLLGVLRAMPRASTAHGSVRDLRRELGVLRRPRLAVVLLLGALVNAATFSAFTFLAPLVTGQAGLDPLWITVALVLFGLGAFAGVAAAGRLSDRRPGAVLAVAGPLLCAGWVALGLYADRPAVLIALSFVQGGLAFAVGGTLIARVLHEARDAPTMAGSFATAAFNVGAAAGPAVGAVALSTGPAERGPVWVAAVLVATALSVIGTVRRIFTRADAGGASGVSGGDRLDASRRG